METNPLSNACALGDTMAVAGLMPHGMQTYQIACGAIEGHRSRDAEVEALKEEVEAWYSCSRMIHDLLAEKMDMTHIPPMSYPEAIVNLLHKEAQGLRDENEQLRNTLAYFTNGETSPVGAWELLRQEGVIDYGN